MWVKQDAAAAKCPTGARRVRMGGAQDAEPANIGSHRANRATRESSGQDEATGLPCLST